LIEFHLIFSVDRNFKITQNDINKILINCQKRTDGFWQLIEIFINVILSYFKILINCQNLSVHFGQLIKCTVG
jgi:hypothetical protein